jgi:hypothetical protein
VFCTQAAHFAWSSGLRQSANSLIAYIERSGLNYVRLMPNNPIAAAPDYSGVDCKQKWAAIPGMETEPVSGLRLRSHLSALTSLRQSAALLLKQVACSCSQLCNLAVVTVARISPEESDESNGLTQLQPLE